MGKALLQSNLKKNMCWIDKNIQNSSKMKLINKFFNIYSALH